MRPILILLSVVTACAFGQVKGDNVILIDTKLPPDEAYKKVGQFLISNGFALDKTDATFRTISTQAKDHSRFNYDYTIMAVVLDSGVVKIRAKWRRKASTFAGLSATDYYDWDYSKRDDITTDILPIIQRFGYEMRFSRE